MGLIDRLRKWFQRWLDPTERMKRKEKRKADEMARFLDQNAKKRS